MKKSLTIGILCITCNLFADFHDIMIANGLYPDAVISSQNDIFITAIDWSIPYVGVSQKISANGNTFWATESSGIFLTESIYPPEYAFLSIPKILPNDNGGAYFLYDYSFWVQDTHHPMLFKTWSHIQKVGSDGEILWGRKGIQLSNRPIGTHGGSTMLDAHFTANGDILVFWNWFAYDDSLTENKRDYKVMMQKINSETGELAYGEHGKFLPVSSGFAWDFLESDTQLYVLHTDSILCLNKEGQKLWHKPLLQSIEYSIRLKSATNSDGDIIILYKKNDQLYVRIFNSQGEILVYDKVLDGLTGIIHHYSMIPFGTTGWIFQSNGLNLIDRNGELTWGRLAFKPPYSDGGKMAFAVSNDSSIYVLDKKSTDQKSSLYLYKINKHAQLLWEKEYCEVGQGIGEIFGVKSLYDDAIVFYEGAALYGEVERPRGTFLQRVTRDGDLYCENLVKWKNIGEQRPDYYAMAYPTPFYHSTTIKLKMPAVSHYQNINIQILNILGQEVIADELTLQYDCAEWRWDGTGANGLEMPSGLYFYKLQAGNHLFVGKLVKGF